MKTVTTVYLTKEQIHDILDLFTLDSDKELQEKLNKALKKVIENEKMCAKNDAEVTAFHEYMGGANVIVPDRVVNAYWKMQKEN